MTERIHGIGWDLEILSARDEPSLTLKLKRALAAGWTMLPDTFRVVGNGRVIVWALRHQSEGIPRDACFTEAKP